MKKRLAAAILAAGLAAPVAAQTLRGVLIDPPNPTTRDRIVLTVVGTQHPECPFPWTSPPFFAFNNTITFRTKFPECGSPIPAEVEFRKEFVLDPLPAGVYYVRPEIAGLPFANHWDLFRVREIAPTLTLGQDDRFQASVEWINPRDGSSGFGFATRLAVDSGALWFFSPDNLEITIKILDGRAVNGHWWVFIASMTDLEATVTVLDDRNRKKTYTQTAGQSRNFVDVNAFAEVEP